MGRSPVDLAQSWRECTRCERHQHRFAVYAPEWPFEVQVVVLGAVAQRAVQAAQTPAPDLLVVVDALRRALGLSEKECTPDYLAACGLGTQLTADEVAACSQRFVLHEKNGAGPQVVVLFGRRTQGFGIEAGLVDEARCAWQPVGTLGSADVVFIDDHNALTKGIQSVARLLNKKIAPMEKENRALLVTKAADLLRVLGDHTGYGVLKPGSSAWSRSKRGSLNVALVASHLAGTRYVAPFHPRGSWPFVVIDVDRHNAVQEAFFNQTLKALQKLFPKSLAVTSSPSAGVHLYVRLPPAMSYADGALIIRAFITLRGLRWKQSGTPERLLRTEVVEVPDQPVRLPFGYGSFQLGSQKPLHEQLEDFIQFVQQPDHGDFDKAHRYVNRTLKLDGHSALVKRRLLLESMLQEEVRDLPPIKIDGTDPWKRVIDEFPGPLQIIAASGIPAYGTRHRWTRALVEQLVNLVPPEDVRDLMLYWLYNRDHVSEDWEVDRAAVERQTAAIIDQAYKRLRGVPEKFWERIEESIITTFQVSSRFPVGSLEHSIIQGSRGSTTPLGWHFQFTLEDILRTAFFIARRFFELGRRQRAVSFREFGRIVGKDNARVMRRMIVGTGEWLFQSSGPVPGRHSRIYELTGAVWPPGPGPRLFCPPARDARNRLY
jgi:hypothetical protein